MAFFVRDVERDPKPAQICECVVGPVSFEHDVGAEAVSHQIIGLDKELVLGRARARIHGDVDDLLIQNDRASRASLLSAFRERKDSSLLAVSSFWEGIDAPGDTLRLVIIVKLPFAVPSTPVEAARARYVEKNGGKPFMEIALPEATLRLKQGIGRLIRSEDDKGVVVILDNRVISTYYGRVMLSSLPQCYFPDDARLCNIPDKIERFLF